MCLHVCSTEWSSTRQIQVPKPIYIYCFTCSLSEWFCRGLHLFESVCVYLSVSKQLLNKIQVGTKTHFAGVLIQTKRIVIHGYLRSTEYTKQYCHLKTFSWWQKASNPPQFGLFKHWINPKNTTAVSLAYILHVSIKNRAQPP